MNATNKMPSINSATLHHKMCLSAGLSVNKIVVLIAHVKYTRVRITRSLCSPKYMTSMLSMKYMHKMYLLLLFENVVNERTNNTLVSLHATTGSSNKCAGQICIKICKRLENSLLTNVSLYPLQSSCARR